METNNVAIKQAQYVIKEKMQRRSEMYLETEFENPAHFSPAFKKQFSYPPTRCKEKIYHSSEPADLFFNKYPSHGETH